MEEVGAFEGDRTVEIKYILTEHRLLMPLL